MSKALKDVDCFTTKHIIHWIVPEKISPSINKLKIHSPPTYDIPEILTSPYPGTSPYTLHNIYNSNYSWFRFTNIMLDKYLHTSNYSFCIARGESSGEANIEWQSHEPSRGIQGHVFTEIQDGRQRHIPPWSSSF